MLHKAMQGKITIRIRLGPGSADQSDQAFEADTLIGSLITYCKQDFRLPEQDNGEMIRLSGQDLAPVLDVDGDILADFGPDQLADFWSKLEKKHARTESR